MDWVKIGSALFMLAMVIYLFPRAKKTIENTPRGSASDWMGFIVPIVGVALFILLLITLV